MPVTGSSSKAGDVLRIKARTLWHSRPQKVMPESGVYRVIFSLMFSRTYYFIYVGTYVCILGRTVQHAGS